MRPTVHLSVVGHVATLTLDDVARKNAMSPELGQALATRVSELAALHEVRAIILTGAGDAFSAGGDLAMLERLRTVSFDEARSFMLGFYELYLSILKLPIPLIAAVRGAAIGAGLAVAMACDVMIVDERAKLAFNFAKLGLYPGMASTLYLPRRVGHGRAADLLLSGRRFSGADAATWGLASESTPSIDVLARAEIHARELAASAPLVTRALLTHLRVPTTELQAALEREATEQAKSYASADLGEGLSAARERRSTSFAGR